ncbi:putative cytochrome P450 [Helianthus annuus]|nr:putative cytochrome P450 [Helianthus annuus]KAJ0684907.1 putative cytochrome P450 [Helianthus annuus]KAJ0688833.1 putative cytochrome P450 [Helianthus annuus]KAJ0870053.1 putative cytochrome P450 [Helianthus annuus]
MTRQIVNNIVSRATLGDVCKNRKNLIENVYFMLRTFSSFNMSNYYPRLNFFNVISGKKAEWLKMHKEIEMILEKIIEEHRSRPRNPDDHEDIVDILLRVKDTGAGFDEPLTNDRVKAIILEMLTAGTSSSSMTIEWAFCEMMKNPEIMRKVQSEVREVMKGDSITEADIQSMDYMKLVVKETMRLHCVPILLPRQNPEKCIVDGYDIPANTRILINVWACATDPDTSSSFLLGPAGECAQLPEGVTPDDLDMRELTAISTVPINPLHIVPISVSEPN